MAKKSNEAEQRYVAFLRGINLGRRRLTMSKLKLLFEQFGYADVATFIASGNVVFSATSDDAAALEAEIAEHLQSALDYEVDTFVRTPAELRKIGRAKLFPAQGDNGVTVHVSFLHERLPAATAKQLASLRTDTDQFRVVGREFYWLRHGRMSDSIVWTLPAAKAIKLPTSTMRSMVSLRKLIAKHCE